MNDEYEDSVSAAQTIKDRVGAVESVAEALFDEWQEELEQFTSNNLRRDSECQLRDTRRHYSRLISSIRRAESAIEPVLATLKDDVLYLKHNLNTRAIASLRGELGHVNADVDKLIEAM